jgi:hypothetical protein
MSSFLSNRLLVFDFEDLPEGVSLKRKTRILFFKTTKNATKLKKIIELNVEIKTSAVVRNQFLIKYLIPKSDDLTIIVAELNTKEVLVIANSIAFAEYSLLLKFSTT